MPGCSRCDQAARAHLCVWDAQGTRVCRPPPSSGAASAPAPRFYSAGSGMGGPSPWAEFTAALEHFEAAPRDRVREAREAREAREVQGVQEVREAREGSTVEGFCACGGGR